jgi:hypothetical protein
MDAVREYPRSVSRDEGDGLDQLAQRNQMPGLTDTSLCCAPLINLWGAYWPAWVPCLVCGILLTIISRLVFSWSGLEPHLGPLLLVYPMLTVAYACGLWLLLYRA